MTFKSITIPIFISLWYEIRLAAKSYMPLKWHPNHHLKLIITTVANSSISWTLPSLPSLWKAYFMNTFISEKVKNRKTINPNLQIWVLFRPICGIFYISLHSNASYQLIILEYLHNLRKLPYINLIFCFQYYWIS